MSEPKHTAGKWKAESHDGRNWIQAGKHQIANVTDIERGDETMTAETEANAKLLAAAPMLLAACRDAEWYIIQAEAGDNGVSVPEALKKIRAAIRKAEK